MSSADYLGILLLVVGGGYLIYQSVVAIRMYRRMRGKMVVTCPETKKPAAVRVAAGKAALQAALGAPGLQLSECSRWPEKQACGQECLEQIEAAPKDCLVWAIVNRWYEGQSCAYCHETFGELHWHDHRPALMSEDGKTVQWTEIPAERIRHVLATHRPVCWNCHITETFRRENPELVVDRRPSPRRIHL